MRHKFYANVAGDFIANDNKRVWSRLRSQVKPSSVLETVNPVKDSEGVLQYHAERILEVMKAHYEDLLTYDPNGLTSNHEGFVGSRELPEKRETCSNVVSTQGLKTVRSGSQK
jgi:hypothetical protein